MWVTLKHKVNPLSGKRPYTQNKRVKKHFVSLTFLLILFGDIFDGFLFCILMLPIAKTTSPNSWPQTQDGVWHTMAVFRHLLTPLPTSTLPYISLSRDNSAFHPRFEEGLHGSCYTCTYKVIKNTDVFRWLRQIIFYIIMSKY